MGKLWGQVRTFPPEIAKGEAHSADARSDIFSFGIILYQLLTNELPFRGNHHAAIRCIIEDDPVSPRKLNRLVPRDLEVICLKCLQKAPTQRFQSAEELADDLRRFQNGEAIHSRPIGPIKSAIRGAIRHPYRTMLAALLVLLAVGGPLVAVRQGQLTEDARAATALAKANEEAAIKNARIAQRHSYAADLGNVVRNNDERNPILAKQLLEYHIPSKGRTTCADSNGDTCGSSVTPDY